MSAPLELESTLEMLHEDSIVNIQIACAEGQKLSAQCIIDCVSEMLFAYFGTTPEEWNKTEPQDLDS